MRFRKLCLAAVVSALLFGALAHAGASTGDTAPAATTAEQAAARALAERRQHMIDDCKQGHGSEIDCEREVDTELRAEGLPPAGRASARAR